MRTRRTLALLASAQETWMQEAVCRGKDPDLFFPTDGGPRSADEARTICATCPVEDECLAYALSTGERGIWGGMNDDEREVLRRRFGRVS